MQAAAISSFKQGSFWQFFVKNSESSSIQLLFKALIGSHLIGSGLVYGHFRLFHLLGLLFLPFFLAKFFKNPKQILRLDFILLVLVLAWYGLSYTWVQDKSLALNYLFYLLNGYYLIFTVCLFVDTLDKLKQTLKVLFFVSLADIFVGILESLTSFRWIVARQSSLNHLFGIDPMYDFYYKDLMKRVSEFKVSYEYMLHQPSGFHWGPNQYGLFLCVLLPFVLFCFRRFWISILLSSIIFYLSFMVASRAVYIGETVIVLAATVFYFFNNKKKMLFTLVASAILVATPLLPLKKMGVNYERAVKISGFLGAAKNYFKNLNFNISLLDDLSPEELRDFDVLPEGELEKFADHSVSQRKIMLIKSFDDFSRSKIRGVGVGNSAQDVGLLFGTTQIHNFWAEIFFELGSIFGTVVFVGLAALFILLSRLTWRAHQVKNEDYMRILPAVVVAIMGIFPGMLAVGTGAYQSVFWLLLALSLATYRVAERDLSQKISK